VAAAQRPRVLIYSRDIGERNDEQEAQDLGWEFISSGKVADHSFVSLVTLDGVLIRTSVHLRLNVSTTPSPVNTPAADSVMMNSYHELGGVGMGDSLDAQPELFCELSAMSGPKCGLGVAELDGKLLVCGGYDRAECLQLVESYCPDTNSWEQGISMREKRGRVQIAVIDETVYAVGGCNGTTELDTVECLPKGETKWKKCCKLSLPRSNSGVCTLSKKLYCVGGWNGQTGIKQCDVYLPEENTWTAIAPLNTGKF
jgi:influenza virus NS1A-binding protein